MDFGHCCRFNDRSTGAGVACPALGFGPNTNMTALNPGKAGVSAGALTCQGRGRSNKKL